MKTLKSLYMTLTVFCLLVCTYFLCQKDFQTNDTLAGFAMLCAAFFFFILFGKVCQKMEEIEKALKWWNKFGIISQVGMMENAYKSGLHFKKILPSGLTDIEILSIYKFKLLDPK